MPTYLLFINRAHQPLVVVFRLTLFRPLETCEIFRPQLFLSPFVLLNHDILLLQ